MSIIVFYTYNPLQVIISYSYKLISTSSSSRYSLKGGDPAAPSDTATLLRLHPSHRACLRRLRPLGSATGFGHSRLPWCDGRCVQDPGTYSPRHSDPRLLAIPASCSRVAGCSPNWDVVSGVRSASRPRLPLLRHCSTCVAQAIRGMMI